VGSLDAIFFDVDDTLYSTTAFSAAARKNAVEAMVAAGLRADAEDLLETLLVVVGEYSSNYGKHFDELLGRLPPSSYEPVNPAVIIASAVVAYHETKARKLKAYPDAIEVLERLKGKKVPLGIITAGVPTKQAEKLVRLGLTRFFEPEMLFISDQLGMSKQNPRLYETVARGVGLAPENCMYVGDNPAIDGDPPNACGMVTVLSRRSGKYAHVQSRTEPRYVIHDLYELERILTRDFGL